MLERLDLGYALNAHMAQGLTADRAIAVMDSAEKNLSNQRLFLVNITRVRDELKLIVDDSSKIARQISRNTGDKTAALETTGEVTIPRFEHGLAAKSKTERENENSSKPLVPAQRDNVEQKTKLPERQLNLGI
jgi:hypothetical protein